MGIKKERHCDFCNSIDGKPRLIGEYIVELKEISLNGESKLVCQGCKVKNSAVRESLRKVIPITKRDRFKSILQSIGF